MFTYLQTLWVQRIPNSGRYEAIDQRHQEWLRLWSRHHLGACQEQSFKFSCKIRSGTNSKLNQGYSFFWCVFLHLWVACWEKYELVELQREHWFCVKGKNWTFLIIHQKSFEFYIKRSISFNSFGKEQLLETSKVIFAGGCAGVNSWIITYPVDVVKTQIQAQHLGTKIHFWRKQQWIW